MKLPVAFLLAGLCLSALAVTIHAQDGGSGTAPNRIRRVSRPFHDHYVVVLRGSDDPEAVGLETAVLRRGRLRHVFRRSARGFATRMPEVAARALANDPRVAYVEEDGLVEATGSVQAGATGDSIESTSAPCPSTGSTSTFVMAEACTSMCSIQGIRTTHTEFGGRAFIAADYIDDDNDGDAFDIGNDDPNPLPDGSDCHGHGTHVAGTIGGETSGVAKGVTLWSHRVLDCTGWGSLSGVIAAIDAVTTDTARRPAVVNMSLATRT